MEEGSLEDDDQDLIDRHRANVHQNAVIMPNSLEIDSFDVVQDTTQTSDFSTEPAPNQNGKMQRYGTYVEPRNESFPNSQAESDNPLRRSQRSNAMYPSKHEKVEVAKKARVNQRGSQGLNRSAYIRNDNAFSVIKTDVANGTSVIGNTANSQSKIQGLAKLIGNKNAFEQAFNQSMVVDSQPKNASLAASAIGHPKNKVDALLEASRKFCIGDREYLFDEEEGIFFMDAPINSQKRHNTPACNTCGENWKSDRDLGHCHFCGLSNCKKCLAKSRNFLPKQTGAQQLDKSGREVRNRGTICKLCDRKFLVKEMVAGTLKQITTHNIGLTVSLTQQEKYKNEIDKLKAEHAEKTGQQKYQVKRLKEAITKIRDELTELTTSSDDFQNDIESGKRKQALLQDQLDEMKQHCEQMEETVSLKIIKLKDLKEKLADAELEAHQTEEQLTKLTRTGRQPLNKSSRTAKRGQTQTNTKSSNNRVSSRSFEEYEDEDDVCGGGSSMVIPEDDNAKASMEEGMACSPQTSDTFIEQTQKVKENYLSVILSEGDSQYFEESECESNYENDDSTLKTGKETSKKKKSKRQIKQEKRIKKKELQVGKNGMCGSGQDKACCAIF